MDRIKIYKPPDGPAQAADFIEGLEPKLRDKLLRQIFYLSRTPFPELEEPHYKHFSIEKYQNLYELREKGRVVVRVIFTPCPNGDYLLLHAFVKRQKRDTKRRWSTHSDCWRHSGITRSTQWNISSRRKNAHETHRTHHPGGCAGPPYSRRVCRAPFLLCGGGLLLRDHCPRDYYKSTSYEDVYGSQYNYGGRNVVDYQIPELEYGIQSTTMTGVMERTILPSFQQTVATGGGGYGISGGGGPITVLVEVGTPGSAGTQMPIAPTTPTVQQPAYTSADGMAYKDGSIGTITYTTIYGTRTYAVETVKIISNSDWSYLQATSGNRITLTTCLADHPESRVVVQAVETRS